ncbi:universal stress protein [Halobacillus andaensis]|uniref:Universal stress protein n=1 Tax=Halobacillus andaensis TaxID=1176239 RepID=A0A917B758_HALAA|nr:universal stress protein [Halobacillus andaensis]MBP2005819.1 nucleotide-binding universal stress UspA family protein [Halobacillus andaensis]GGF25820.1 universal stress protein [Halobacillus andaensis]
MKERILVAYDGSELSKKAIQEALTKEEANNEAEVHVVSVIKPTGPFTNAKMAESIGTELAEQLKSDLEAIKEEFKTVHHPIVTEALVGKSESNPGVKICDYADEHDIDLIIIGNRGLGNVKKFFLGSVSNNVVQHAKCPVLVIK